MRWGWKIGRLFGIEVKIHATFLIVLIWAGFSHWFVQRDLVAAFAGICFVAAVFGCVLLHEFGHALAARRFGIKTRDITLLPIGGVARLEQIPDDPKQEIVVALAGPAVNLAIAAVIYGALQLTGAWAPLSRLDLAENSLLAQLMTVNIFLLLFNLLPAFPMDGGRVLRGILAIWLNYVKATRIAVALGQAMAFTFGVAGLFLLHNPILVLVGIFVWVGALQEGRFAEMKSMLGGVQVERAMLTTYTTVSPEDSLERVATLILEGAQQDFPVVENGKIVGVISRSAVLLGLEKAGQAALVGPFMNRDFKVVDASEPLDAIVPRLQENSKVIPVTRFGELVGLITPENVGEFVMIQSALEQRRRAA